MTRVLVLGHKGMLGNIACSYLRKNNFEVLTTDTRWGDPQFKESILSLTPDYIINCIGLIPQRKPADEEYAFINTELPLFLDTLGIRIIHATTDCEFLGDIPSDTQYPKTHPRDAVDIYGKSKAKSSRILEETGKHTKIIRTSIIGHDEKNHLGLLDWFLYSEGEVKGFTNHYWNGITTLEWVKQAEKIIQHWEDYPTLVQLGTEQNMSKFEVLQIAKEVYAKDCTIVPFETQAYVNRCLASDSAIPSLKTQLEELKAFYAR